MVGNENNILYVSGYNTPILLKNQQNECLTYTDHDTLYRPEPTMMDVHAFCIKIGEIAD